MSHKNKLNKLVTKYESERMVNFQIQKYVGHVEELSKNAGIIIIGNIKHGY